MITLKKDLFRKRQALKNIRTLVADGDEQMAGVLSHNLKVMGFGETVHVKDGGAAVEALKNQAFDMLITEWPMEPMDGIELVRALRRNEQVQTRRMPIIMLTGKAEKTDVETARDSGITEFVIKPFTSQALFTRLERLVEHPRPFLLTKEYIGPDRRCKKDPADGEDRRKTIPKPVTSLNASQDDNAPRMLPPDATLKRKMLLGTTLSTIVTAEVLVQAQEAIEALRDESQIWLRDDVAKLEAAYKQLLENVENALKDFKDSTLSIKSRAGTFGYHAMSEAARLLYRFASGEYKAGMAQHNTIMLKHIEALKVIFGGSISGKGNDASYDALTKELDLLVTKYRAFG